jgi:hypothetical protein
MAGVRYSSWKVNVRLLLPAAAAALCACQNMPEPYAPPVQRQPFENFKPYRAIRVVNMSDDDAQDHFVQDIAAKLEGSWRWCQQRPTVWIRMPYNENVRYTIDFTLPEATFQQTGPVTVSFYVNGRLLDQMRYTSPGMLHFEKPVPQDWIKPGDRAMVAAGIDKLWNSPDVPGARLGFILTRIGLTQ